MTQTLRTLALAGVGIVALAANGAAQSGSVKADVLKDWTAMKETMIKISNEMPEEKFGFKATPPQRDYGQQIMHIATTHVQVLQGLGGKATPPKFEANLTKKADIVKALSDQFDYGTALINELSDQTLLDTVTVRFLGTSTKVRVFFYLIGHAWDIYGQMAVYLRLNGHVPPASQGRI